MERKEAIEIIKRNWTDSSFTMLREALETIIPELKESEDENIRKAIKSVVSYNVGNNKIYGVSKEDMLAWLEKQGEQKPAIDMITPEESLGVDGHIEYIRKDAFIEKAKKWFEEQNEWFDLNNVRHCGVEDFNDFEKYIRGE